jgi:hypothetical protein
MRTIAIISAAALIVATSPVLAQTAPEPLLPVATEEAPDAARLAHLELAERYLELTQGGDLVKQMRGQIEEGYDSSGMPAEQRNWMAQNMGDMFAEVMEMTIEALRDDVADSFTVHELETAIAFYESPTGRSVVRKQVDMNRELQEVMGPLLLPRLTSLMEKFCVRFDCEALGDAAAKQRR